MVRGMGQVRPLEPQAQSAPKNSVFNRNNVLVQYLKKSKLILKSQVFKFEMKTLWYFVTLAA